MQLWNRYVLASKLRSAIVAFDEATEAIIGESRCQNSDEPDETGLAAVLMLDTKDYVVRVSYTFVSILEPVA